jgi:hypothetical protein
MLASSPSASLPSDLRRFCDEFAKSLYLHARSAQAKSGLREALNLDHVAGQSALNLLRHCSCFQWRTIGAEPFAPLMRAPSQGIIGARRAIIPLRQRRTNGANGARLVARPRHQPCQPSTLRLSAMLRQQDLIRSSRALIQPETLGEFSPDCPRDRPGHQWLATPSRLPRDHQGLPPAAASRTQRCASQETGVASGSHGASLAAGEGDRGAGLVAGAATQERGLGVG